jgi:phytoene synthase
MISHYSEAIIRRYSHTFAFASRFLPIDERHAVAVLYTFCRVVDDIADELPPDVAIPALDRWLEWIDALGSGESLPTAPSVPPMIDVPPQVLAESLAAVVTRHHIPVLHLRELVEGVRTDATRTRIRNASELRAFCYAAAGTVGLMMAHVLGVTSPEGLERAERLGLAMQLTNILRDVGEDWRRGRLYLPLDAIEAHGVDLSDLDRATVSPALQGVLREHIEQARAWYVEGLAGVGLLPARVRLPILVAGRLYRAILRQIEVNGYDVLTRRARTSRLQKITALIRASVTLGSIQVFTGTIRSVR